MENSYLYFDVILKRGLPTQFPEASFSKPYRQWTSSGLKRSSITLFLSVVVISVVVSILLGGSGLRVVGLRVG